MRESDPHTMLSDRQQRVLRALVSAYVAEAEPVSSTMVSHLLPIALSSASIRNTMAELEERGLVQKPHASSGRVPTPNGIRIFVDDLLSPRELAAYERRSLDHSFDVGGGEQAVRVASRMLSEHSHQLGFVLAPRISRLRLRHVSLVRLSSERLLVVLVTEDGQAHRVILDDPGWNDQRELEAVSSELSRRVAGRTLAAIRVAMKREVAALRKRADRVLSRVLSVGLQLAEEPFEQPVEIVVSSRLALLSQPELCDPEYLREVFSALETQERLIELLDSLLDTEGVSVALGEELAEPGLLHSALVVAPYGLGGSHLGMLGVLGPQRMDYAHIIPLVDYCSGLLSGKLEA